jgi:MFS family permease
MTSSSTDQHVQHHHPRHAPADRPDGASPVAPVDAAPQERTRGYELFLGLAAVGICIATITPVMASMTFKLQHIAADPGRAAAQLGVVLGVGALFAVVANPVVGRLSDRTTSRFGMRRPWILGGALVGLVALVGIGVASDAVLVGVLWCVAQVSLNASLAAVISTVADQVPVERRGRASAIVGLSIPLSIVTGTALVSALPSDVLRFGVPGAIALVTTAAFALVLRDRVLTEQPAGRLDVRQIAGAFVFNPRRHPDFGWTWLSKFLVMFGYAGIATFFPLFLADRFGLDEEGALQVIVVANLVSTIATVAASPVAGLLSDRLRRRRVFVAAAGGVMVVGLVLLAFAPSLTVVFIAQGIIGAGAGSFTAVDLALGTEVLPNPEDTAKDLGVLTAANSLPQSIAPVIAPLVIAAGAATPLGGYPSWYLFGAVVVLGGAITVYRVRGVR